MTKGLCLAHGKPKAPFLFSNHGIPGSLMEGLMRKAVDTVGVLAHTCKNTGQVASLFNSAISIAHFMGPLSAS